VTPLFAERGRIQSVASFAIDDVDVKDAIADDDLVFRCHSRLPRKIDRNAIRPANFVSDDSLSFCSLQRSQLAVAFFDNDPRENAVVAAVAADFMLRLQAVCITERHVVLHGAEVCDISWRENAHRTL
jgi:hypothetical protein